MDEKEALDDSVEILCFSLILLFKFISCNYKQYKFRFSTIKSAKMTEKPILMVSSSIPESAEAGIYTQP